VGVGSHAIGSVAGLGTATGRGVGEVSVFGLKEANCCFRRSRVCRRALVLGLVVRRLPQSSRKLWQGGSTTGVVLGKGMQKGRQKVSVREEARDTRGRSTTAIINTMPAFSCAEHRFSRDEMKGGGDTTIHHPIVYPTNSRKLS